jgi:hypothetical protein
VITIYKAQSVANIGVPDLDIRADQPVPNVGLANTWMADARDFYREQAVEIATRLIQSLPGGTIDALLVQLLDHKRSLLQVVHEAPR